MSLGAQAQNTATADSLLREGLALAGADRLEDAHRLLGRAAGQYPSDKRFPLELAGVSYREKRNQSARRYLYQALRLDPSDAYANEFLGTLFLLDGNLEAALKYWNRVGKPLIQDVRFSTQSTLDPVLTARAVDLSGGQIFTLRRLWQTESNLERLDVFSGYRFDLTSREDQRYDASVQLDSISQPFGGWIGGLLPYLRALPYQTVDVDRYNIGRQAINFASLWRWDPNKRRFNAQLSAPLRADPRYGYRFVLDGRDERWNLTNTYRGAALDDLRLRRIEAGGDLVFGLGDRLQWTSGVRTVGRWFDHGDRNPVFNGGWSLEPRNRLNYRLMDWPDRRLRVNASATLNAGKLFTRAGPGYGTAGGDVNAAWLPQARGDRWEIEGRIRASMTSGEVPFDEFFQLGMERDNDLWLRGIEGTRAGLKGGAPLGVNYALEQTDVQRTLFHAPFVTVKAGPFFDAGRISGPSPQFGSQGWVQATGIQARIATFDRVSVSLVYGRDIRNGQSVFYTAVTR
jgi:tetratricopeptide (TPR) repeat protein